MSARNFHKTLNLSKGPSIKDVGIFEGGRGVSNFDVARYYKVGVR